MSETLGANKVNTMAQGIDVLEDYLLTLDRELLEILLFDRTTRRNILWATKDYEEYGADYAELEEITPAAITGAHSKLIQRARQRRRIRRAAHKEQGGSVHAVVDVQQAE